MSKKINHDKNLYRKLCREGMEIPIFYQDWWLDVTCGEDNWKVILYEEDPNVVALMTYFIKKRFSFEIITVPPLTKFSGPFFLKNFNARKQQSILTRMIDQLPEVSSFSQTLPYQIENWLAYKWKGYSQTTYYSYRLIGLKDRERIWQGMDADYRNNKIRKASQQYTVHEDLDFETLFELTVAPFRRQNIALPVSRTLLQNLLAACNQREKGKSLYARDKEGNVVAAVYLVWDTTACYLLLAGENDQSRSDGAGVYLTWKAIEYASEILQVPAFDFLGGMAENLERTRRQYGAQQVPYFLIRKSTGLFRFLDIFRGK
ncbi:MAG: GNAT family N-acetyltransferase [Saprospiraceae bacterium]|nr:GNAT family N-acetyltransferase [Saprospiraceae bacterium]